MEPGLLPRAATGEKFLKAFLESVGARIPKLHSLAELRALCEARDASFDQLTEGCLLLDRFYIPTRYPSALVGSLPEGLPNEEDAAEAMATASAIHRLVTSRIAAGQ